jgi:hypothetical protein
MEIDQKVTTNSVGKNVTGEDCIMRNFIACTLH